MGVTQTPAPGLRGEHITAEPATLDRNRSAVLIMDFQLRIINNFASDPPGVIKRAAQAL